MAKLSILAGATSQSVNVFIQANNVTTGAGLTGLVFNSTSLVAYYAFNGANGGSNAITLATLSTPTSAYSSGGFKEIDATNMPGLYRFDIPNAAIAGSKGRSSTIMLSGFATMAPCLLEIELTGWDNQDAVHGGMSALPNTACTTNASLLTSGTGTAQISTSSGQVLQQAGTGAGQLDFTSGVLKSNMVQVLGGACPAVSVTGVPKVDLQDILGTAVSTPATAGILDVNVKNMNNIAGTAITTIKAVQGLTTADTITTTTNLTNAATAGDFTAAMKTSLNAATPTVTTGTISSGVINAASINADTGLILRANTATAAATGSLTLDAGATTTVDYYKDCWLVITSSTGIGQARRISAYSSGRVASITPNWATTPSATSTYAIHPAGYVDLGAVLGTASAGAAGSVGIDWAQVANPSSTVNLSGTTTNLVNTLTTYTGNTVQTGDSYTRLGAPAGASVSADIAAVKSSVGSPMQTYTQPTGFLAATFPTGTIANTTNITAGTITTTTNLTNAPTVGDFTAAMKTSLNASTPAAITGNVGGNVTGSVGSVLAAVAITSNRKKGATATFEILMQDSTTGGPKTGLTVASTLSKDGGAAASTTNAVTEIGLGQYQIVLTAAEMTMNNGFLQCTATGALTFNLSIQTQP